MFGRILSITVTDIDKQMSREFVSANRLLISVLVHCTGLTFLEKDKKKSGIFGSFRFKRSSFIDLIKSRRVVI